MRRPETGHCSFGLKQSTLIKEIVKFILKGQNAYILCEAGTESVTPGWWRLDPWADDPTGTEPSRGSSAPHSGQRYDSGGESPRGTLCTL